MKTILSLLLTLFITVTPIQAAQGTNTQWMDNMAYGSMLLCRMNTVFSYTQWDVPDNGGNTTNNTPGTELDYSARGHELFFYSYDQNSREELGLGWVLRKTNNDHLFVKDADDLSFTDNEVDGEFSVIQWADALQHNKSQALIGKWDANGHEWMLVIGGDMKFFFYMKDGITGATKFAKSLNTVPLGFHMWGATHKDGIITLYVDGEIFDSVTTTPPNYTAMIDTDADVWMATVGDSNNQQQLNDNSPFPHGLPMMQMKDGSRLGANKVIDREYGILEMWCEFLSGKGWYGV